MKGSLEDRGTSSHNILLEALINTGFSVPQIADILVVSVRTVRRRFSEYGLAIRSTFLPSALSNWMH